MDYEEKKFAINALRKMFIGSQLDGIKFGLSPTNTFVYFKHYNTQVPDLLWIDIKSKWGIYQPNTTVFPNSEEEIESLSEDKEFKILFDLRREEIVDIRLGDHSPHLFITFESGKILFVNGYHETRISWLAGDGGGYCGNEWLVECLPGNGIMADVPKWIAFEESEYNLVWNNFKEKLKFKPSTTNFPSFQVPSPYITFDISDEWWSDEDEQLILKALQNSTTEGETVYALEWKHTCYKGNQLLELEVINELPICLYPDGDYYFIVNENFSWGFLAHPWEQSVTVFGELVSKINEERPENFNKILRQSF